MEKIILIIGAIAYGLFIIQFLMSLFGYDTDIDFDIDFDGDADFSLSDIVSFKGLIHFIMGISTYLSTHIFLGTPITMFSWVTAMGTGVLFVIGLYYVYKWCITLQHTPQREEGDLGERYVKIIRHERELTYVGTTTINGAYDMFTVESSKPLVVGESYKITKFINNKIYI